jgi:hypothetical protein
MRGWNVVLAAALALHSANAATVAAPNPIALRIVPPRLGQKGHGARKITRRRLLMSVSSITEVQDTSSGPGTRPGPVERGFPPRTPARTRGFLRGRDVWTDCGLGCRIEASDVPPPATPDGGIRAPEPLRQSTASVVSHRHDCDGGDFRPGSSAIGA